MPPQQNLRLTLKISGRIYNTLVPRPVRRNLSMCLVARTKWDRMGWFHFLKCLIERQIGWGHSTRGIFPQDAGQLHPLESAGRGHPTFLTLTPSRRCLVFFTIAALHALSPPLVTGHGDLRCCAPNSSPSGQGGYARRSFILRQRAPSLPGVRMIWGVTWSKIEILTRIDFFSRFDWDWRAEACASLACSGARDPWLP